METSRDKNLGFEHVAKKDQEQNLLKWGELSGLEHYYRHIQMSAIKR